MALSLVSETGQTYVLRSGTNLVGRAPGNDIVLDDPKVSRRHASILVAGNTISLVDHDSTHGTLLNERVVPASRPTVVAPGSTVTFGHTSYRVAITDPRQSSLRARVGLQREATANPIVRMGTVAGAMATILGLVFMINPKLDPRNAQRPATSPGLPTPVMSAFPEVMGVVLGKPEIHFNVTLGQYRNQKYQDYYRQFGGTDDQSLPDDETSGFVVNSTVTMAGFVDRAWYVRATLFDAEQDSPVPDYEQSLGCLFSGEASVDSVLCSLWVASRGEGDFYVSLEAMDTQNTLDDASDDLTLGSVRSEAITFYIPEVE